MVNEIWVPSAFSEQAVANVSARPVFRVPPPVAAGIADAGVEPDTGALSFLTVARPAWGRRRDLAMANPSGAIDAFCAAFGNGSGPTLRVVLTGGRTQAEAAGRSSGGAATSTSSRPTTRSSSASS
jgi:hypothetical protein